MGMQMDTPRYRLITQQYLNDDLIEPGEVIDYDGIPNENMEPMNESARNILIEFIGTLEDGKRTPDIGDIVLKQVANRPKHAPELSSPELIAAVNFIKNMAEAKQQVSPEDKKKSYTLPFKREDVPQTGADPKAMIGRKQTVVRHGQVPEDTSQKIRKVTGHSPATVA